MSRKPHQTRNGVRSFANGDPDFSYSLAAARRINNRYIRRRLAAEERREQKKARLGEAGEEDI
jgi:hypothetical protein